MEQAAYEALRAAQLNEHNGSMVSSAKLCAVDAERHFNTGAFALAHAWALRSLSYSVGKFSPLYTAHAASVSL